MRRGIDLRRFYVAAIIGLTILLGILFSLVLGSSREAIMKNGEQQRLAATAKVADRVQAVLDVAQTAVSAFEEQVRQGVIPTGSLEAIEAALYAELLRHDKLFEMTYTWATPNGENQDGPTFAKRGRGQISVLRVINEDEPERIITRVLSSDADGAWSLRVRPRPHGGGLASAEFREGNDPTGDPTEHLTFKAAARKALTDNPSVWSDLFFAEVDSFKKRADEKRTVMTVQRAVLDARKNFLGVVRAGLVSKDIDSIGMLHVDDKNDPYRIFICDKEGRLITRLSPDDTFAEQPDEDVRVVSAHPDPVIARALENPAIAAIDKDHAVVTRENIDGRDYVVTFKTLPEQTHDWLVGVSVPESYYLAGLVGARNRLLIISALLMTSVLLGGALSLRAIRAGLGRVVEETARMRRFDFTPSQSESAFKDVNDALRSLEVAKTALRAMGRYVPVDLVRILYEAGQEPMLGGELIDVSIMFSDIKDFTTVSEKLSPDELAAALGKYLEVMTAAIAETGGTIDKYIGDAVMVIWNAPLRLVEHARRACRAALACQKALAVLFASPAWAGLPVWTTRIGLHRAVVMVGHFGSPHRLSYTALGDGVNLASRVEGLNKLYGTGILVTESVREAAGDEFRFRRIDRVAVKGKSEAVEMVELCGAAADTPVDPRWARYEEALELYFAGKFGDALPILETQPDDPPSVKLALRCRKLLEHPPASWDGVYRADEK
jgi:adenylate cyclase